MAFRALLAWALLFAAPSIAPSQFKWPTLREVLVEHNAAPSGFTDEELQRPITTYGILEDPEYFAIGFYWDQGGEWLHDPVEIWLLDRGSGRAIRRQLHRDDAVEGTSHGIGGIRRIRRAGDKFYMATHLTPSAGNTFVLSKNLEPEYGVYGWPIGFFKDGTAVFHKSQMHFAPVHPLEVSVYFPKSRKEVQIYPPVPYQRVRQAYIEWLKVAIAGWTDEQRMEYNRPFDPERFTSTFVSREIATNDSTDSIAFSVIYDAPGSVNFRDGKNIVCVCRAVRSEAGPECLELESEEVLRQIGSALPVFLTRRRNLDRLFDSARNPAGP